MSPLVLAYALLVNSLSASAAQTQEIFACQSGLRRIRVFSAEPVEIDPFGRLGLHAGQELRVHMQSPGSHRSYLAVVLRVENGGITKHAPMAHYVLARGTLPAPLTLTLRGIDELQDRHSCRLGKE